MTPVMPPGTLTIDPEAPPPELILIDYTSQQATRQLLTRPRECVPYLDSPSVSWLDVRGLGAEDIFRELGQVFGLHPLTLEDVVNVPQRPKVEQYPDHLLLITRMVAPKKSPASRIKLFIASRRGQIKRRKLSKSLLSW